MHANDDVQLALNYLSFLINFSSS